MTDPRAEFPFASMEQSIDRLVSLLEPISRVIQPQLHGVEHLPAGGSLLVGNHTILWPPRRAVHDGRDLEAPQTCHPRRGRARPLTQFRSGLSLRGVLELILLGVFVALCLGPFVEFLTRGRMPRVLAILAAYVTLFGSLVVLGLVAVPPIVSQIE